MKTLSAFTASAFSQRDEEARRSPSSKLHKQILFHVCFSTQLGGHLKCCTNTIRTPKMWVVHAYKAVPSFAFSAFPASSLSAADVRRGSGSWDSASGNCYCSAASRRMCGGDEVLWLRRRALVGRCSREPTWVVLVSCRPLSWQLSDTLTVENEHSTSPSLQIRSGQKGSIQGRPQISSWKKYESSGIHCFCAKYPPTIIQVSMIHRDDTFKLTKHNDNIHSAGFWSYLLWAMDRQSWRIFLRLIFIWMMK